MSGAQPTHRCPAAARWLPRALAGALLAAGALVYIVLPAGSLLAAVTRTLVLAAAGLGALWIVRSGPEARMVVGVEGQVIRLASGGWSADLPLAELRALDWDLPLGPGRSCFPALVLVDARERRLRIPAFIADGRGLLREILDAAREPRLAAWAEARRLEARLAHGRSLVAAGYAIAGAILLAAVLFVLRTRGGLAP